MGPTQSLCTPFEFVSTSLQVDFFRTKISVIRHDTDQPNVGTSSFPYPTPERLFPTISNLYSVIIAQVLNLRFHYIIEL